MIRLRKLVGRGSPRPAMRRGKSCLTAFAALIAIVTMLGTTLVVAEEPLIDLGPGHVDDPSAVIAALVLFEPREGPGEITGVENGTTKHVAKLAKRLCREDGQPTNAVRLVRRKMKTGEHRFDVIAVRCE